MKIRNSIFVILLAGVTLTSFYSCKKENLFRSESEIRNSLKGTWNLIAIPKYDTIRNPDNSYYLSLHVESWTFNDANVEIIVNANPPFLATYSIHTSATKAELKLESVPQAQAGRYEGTWDIVKLNDDILAIANDKEGTTGLLQLEFQKKK
jgi:hypothetical protein